jgi:hypothetical protein
LKGEIPRLNHRRRRDENKRKIREEIFGII